MTKKIKTITNLNCSYLICTEAYTASKSDEDWIQCLMCVNWAYERCIKSDKYHFTCSNWSTYSEKSFEDD